MRETKRIYPMALEPKPGLASRFHTVGLPPELQEALFEVLSPRRQDAALPTRELRQELRRWVDLAVDLMPVRRGEGSEDWVVALAPVDLDRLCNVVATWVEASCPEETRCGSAHRRLLSMLEPSSFSGLVRERELRLFDDGGRPCDERESLAFSVLSAQVANSIVGVPFEFPGWPTLGFDRVADGTGGSYALVSDVLEHDGCPWALGMRFHVETLPVGRRARLYVNFVVQRFVGGKWQERPYLPKDVRARVRTENGTWRVVPFGYDRDKRRADWNDMARRNYEQAGYGRLPELDDYLSHIAEHAFGGRGPTILSPYGTSTPWAEDSRVGTGIPMVDKAPMFEAVAEAIAGYAEPVPPMASENRAKLHLVHEDAKDRLWKKHPDEAQSQHDEWVRSNRRRLAGCTGEEAVTIEIVGSSADAKEMACLREEVSDFLGGEGEGDGLDLRVAESCLDDLLAPMKEAGDAGERLRWLEARKELGEAKGLHACLVVLPGAKSFEDGRDPKAAIRVGLALSGRLSQFLVPGDESLTHRARSAVRDLVRQMGFVPELRKGRGGVDIEMPLVGLRIHRAPQGKERAEFPVLVRYEPASGSVTVDCPLFPSGRLPYWKALIELARVSTSKEYGALLREAGGERLKAMLDALRASSTEDTVLLAQAYGVIRHRHWWPGLSDRSLADGRLLYGPEKGRDGKPSSAPFEQGGSKLHVLRVRSGADGEVPDYYTDEREPGEGTDGVPARPYHQGIFPADGYAYALTEKPYDPAYYLSSLWSKADAPYQRFAEKTINEYCLLTPGDDRLLLELSRYAEATRGCMVQLANTGMNVNLPAPLHLAEGMDEYVWAKTKAKRPKRTR